MMPTHPSPLRYPGGKATLAPLLSDIIVHNDLHDGLFVEPFAGGAGAALQLMFNELASEILINDADPRIYAFWRAVVHQTDELIDRIKTARVTMATWRKCRQVYDSPPRGHRQLDLAFATFFLNRANRSGILMGGGPIGGYQQVGKWKIDARFNRDDLAKRIERIAKYKDRITVTRQDARQLLENRDLAHQTLVYLDPPYYRKGQRLYLNSLEPRDHEQLAEFLLSSPPFRWVLTYDNVEEIRHLYTQCNPIPFELSYSAYKRNIGKELLIIDPRLRIPTEQLCAHHRPGCLQFEHLN